jgi:cellobiose epimerase
LRSQHQTDDTQVEATAGLLHCVMPSAIALELRRILDFWLRHTCDHERGGFYGTVANDLTVDRDAPKGLVLCARILWTFSRAYRFEPRDDYLTMARRALAYLQEQFKDREYGGYFYLLDAFGRPLRTRKQTYAHAFVLYGVSEYILATGQREWLSLVHELIALIERSHDPEYGGYLEAYTRDWQLEQDVRLSEVDLNEKKSMNTHLHVLEAYANTLRVLPLPALKLKLAELVDIMLDRVLDPATNHFHLFFDADWSVKSNIVSFGHDIEGSWLLVEAADLLGDAGLRTRVRAAAIAMADTARREALSPDGAIFYEARRGGTLDDDRHWWPQAEALVGFVNAYQLTGDRAYLEIVTRLWDYVESNIVDRRYGEWFWKVDRHGMPDPAKPKVSEWKCPYHNSRACFELLDRLSSSGRHDHGTRET